MNLLKQPTIRLKIKIIAFSAIFIIFSMLVSIILFSNYFEEKTNTLHENKIKIQQLSATFKSDLLNKQISENTINKYFNEIQKLSNHENFSKKDSNIYSYLNTIIIILSILLIIFMFFGYLLDKTIENSLKSLQKGMKLFFSYIIKRDQKADKIKIIYPDDEVGEILHYINENLYDIRKTIENERKFNIQLEKNIIFQTDKLTEKSNYLDQYKYMVDEAESVIQFDLYGNITDANEHYCNLSKYSKKELIGQPIVNFLNSNGQNHDFYKEITNVIKEGTVYKGINSDLSKNNEVFTTKTVILPMLSKDKLIEYFICLRTDITQMVKLTDEIIETQKDVISTMGEIGESRSKETGLHVKRVAEYSKLLATKYGLNKEQCELIYIASPMHDIGKVGIPDSILKKPGKLTNEEFKVMKTHTTLGYNMLKHSHREILGAAAIIANEHHEKYDGTGYPNQKKGESIHIFGRITALADNFDALGSVRCYKEAWELEKILELFTKEKGKHFDPILIEIFFENIDEFISIRDKYKDNF